MSRSNSWTPHSYPIQSPPPPSVPSTPTTPTKHIPSPTKIPRNIRALRNGNTQLKGRNIIVCLDGTGDKFDGDNSNIVHLVSCLKKSDPSQITYYQSGIGTYDGKGMSNGINAAVDMAVGSGLGVHIRDAYHFLMQNYKDNDRIILFGFSRGAYTARCLAGMIHKVGLLPAHNKSQIPFAYEYYKDGSKTGWKMSIDFKRTFCMDVSVHFIGVFDCVASVGFIPRRLPLSSTPYNKAKYFRHAMALDEHRAKFKSCRFQRQDYIGDDEMEQLTAAAAVEDGERSWLGRKSSVNGAPSEKSETLKGSGEETMYNYNLTRRQLLERSQDTDVLEVWFAGAHADVGGGAVKNEKRHKLSQIPLRWMLRQCFECNTGIIFKTHRLAEEGLDIHTLFPQYTPLDRPRVGPAPSLLEKFHEGRVAPISRRSTVLQPVDENEPQGLHEVKLHATPEDGAAEAELHAHWVPEQVEDYFDALSRINDQLIDAKGWWVLELWPIKVKVQETDSDAWVKKVACNLGRYRPVMEEAPNLHWTVQQRIEALGYVARVRLDRKANWNVVV